MSGETETYISVSQSSYNDMMGKLRRSDDQKRRMDAVQVQLAQADRNLAWQREQQTRQQAAFESAVKSLSSELRSATQRFQQELASQKAQFQHETRRLDYRLDVQAAFMKAQFDDLQRVESNKESAARQWLGDVRVMLDYIRDEMPHQKFAPGELDDLEQKFQRAESNMQVDFGAALSSAQERWGEALKLKTKIEQGQLEWNAHLEEAQKGARELLAEVEVQQAAKWLMDTEEGSVEIEAEVDYWSNGDLGRLQQQVTESLKILEARASELDLADLKDAIAKQDALSASIEKCVSLAQERLIASQLRVNIAEDVLAELEGAGWKLEDSAWQGEESDDGKGWKNSYHMKLRDLGNNEIVTVVVPEPTPQGAIRNRLQFAYYPKDNSDARFASAQTNNLNGVLARLGLSGKGLSCVPGQEGTIRGDAERQDFERVRNALQAKARQSGGQ